MFIRNVRYCHFLVLSHCSNIGIDISLLHESNCVIVWQSQRLHLHLEPEDRQHQHQLHHQGEPGGGVQDGYQRGLRWESGLQWFSAITNVSQGYSCYQLRWTQNRQAQENCGLTGPFPSWLVAATYHGDGGVHEAMLRWETACGEMKCASVWDDDPYSQSLYVSRKAVCQVEEYCLGHQLLWGLQHLLSPQPFSRQAL